MKKPDVRSVLVSQCRLIPYQKVAVYLSGGMDSLSCAFALREAGKEVAAYTFHVSGMSSTDASRARVHCRKFGIPLMLLPLDTSVGNLVRKIREAKKFGASKKTEIETLFPFLETIDRIGEQCVVTGHGADGHFLTSRRALVHFKGGREDEFRIAYHNRKEKTFLPDAFLAHGKHLFFPYYSREMLDQFLGTTWESVNKPKQKQSIVDSYPEHFAQTVIQPHTNLHLSDSGISSAFEALLRSPYNTRGARTVIAVYNDL